MGDAGPSEGGGIASSHSNLLVCACGAAALLVLPDYLVRLSCEAERSIRVVMSAAAMRIMSPATVRLVSEQVYCDGEHNAHPGHVALATWADQLVVLPATAHILAQGALGLAGGLVASTLIAYEGAVVYFPSMNGTMWNRPSVQRNVRRLRDDGHVVVEPVNKPCWEVASATMKVGPGLPSPAAVASALAELRGGTPAPHRRELPQG